MKRSIDTDEQCLYRIILHITEIRDCLTEANISTSNELENSKFEKYAITQLITNIYELRKKLRPEMLQWLDEFSRIELHFARNIASHDYVSVNFKVIYHICSQLTNEAVVIELKTILEGINDGTYK